jgi:Domain of unknown function (DUF4430)
MKRRFNFAVLLAILVVIFSLTGCGSSTASNQDTKKETKTVEVAAKADNKAEQESKQQITVEETKPAAAPAVTEEKQQPASKPAAPKMESGPSPQPVQKSSAAAKPSTPATTSKSAVTSTAKPAGTTTSSTTNQAAKTTTNTKTTTQTTPVVKPAVPAPKPVATVTLSIVGPKDKGTILAPTKVKINDGDTIFDVVKRTNIDIDSSGSGATAYIEGIDNIYEFDYGAKSGWVFKHNGVSITKSIGVIKVKAGDRIECYYTE